jgi:hypothetical protein
VKNGSHSATTLPGSAALPFVIPTGAYPDFLLRAANDDHVMRLSVERAACRSSKPRVSTGNSGERSGGTCGLAVLSWKCFSTERSVVDLQSSPQQPVFQANRHCVI